MRPVNPKFPISNPYGAPGDYAAGHHTGTDFACPKGTPVMAPVGGRVETQPYASSYGIHVIVYGLGGKRAFLLAHLSRVAPGIDGKIVKVGTVIGWSGSTGNSTGPHLHAEQRRGPGFRYADCVKPTAWRPS